MFMKLVSLSDTLIHNRRGIKSHKVIDKEDIKEILKRKIVKNQ
jgi:DNA-directed RNA polymerase subunit H (RpoH/RPB5)